jgi:hypothetical protein
MLEAKEENGVVVLGMHRSGTSATTRAINLLGVPLCREDDLWRELPGNPTGYWESASLAGFNETLLRRIGSAWWCPPRPGEIDRVLDDDDARRDAARLFRSLYVTPTWVWKDPRICLTLPLWRSVLDAHLSCVLVLRNPLEVAESLAARDGIAPAWGLALWERYLRLALDSVAGLRVLVTEFAQLLDAPGDWSKRTAEYLGRRGIATDPARAGVDAFVQPGLRTTAYGDSDLVAWRGVSQEQRELYEAARGLVGAWDAFEAPTLPPESPDTGALLDALRDGFPLNRLPAREAVASLLRRTPSPQPKARQR